MNTIPGQGNILVPNVPTIKASDSEDTFDREDVLKAKNEITITNASAQWEAEGYEPDQLTGRLEEKQAIETFNNAGIDALNAKANRNLSSHFSIGYHSIAGLNSALGGMLQSGQTEIHQTVSNSTFYTRIKDFDPSAHVDRLQSDVTKDVSTFLEIKTKEGDTIKLSISVDYTKGEMDRKAGLYYSRNIRINMEVDGELSEKEIAEIDKFSKALEQQIDRVSRGKGLDIESFNLFEDDTLSSIKFDYRPKGGQSVFNFEMVNNDDTRSLIIDYGTNKINLKLDKTDGVFNIKSANASRVEYLSQLTEGLDKSSASKEERRLLLDSVDALFSNLKGIGSNNVKPANAITSGLPDFEISFNRQRSNYIPNALDISLKQNTQITESSDGISVVQKHNYDLYSEQVIPLDHLEHADYFNGNYKLRTVEEHQSRISHLEINTLNQLVSASIEKQAEVFTSLSVFNEHKLLDKSIEHLIKNSTDDLTAEVLMMDKRNEHRMIESLLKPLDLPN